MDIVITLLYFLITSNILILLLLRSGFKSKISDSLLLFFSYGVGPFIPALIFYCLIWLFPGRNDTFYRLIISGLYLLFFVIGFKDIKNGIKLQKEALEGIFNIVRKLPKLLILISTVFISLYTIQLFAFPIVDNDSALYLNQSEAVYEYKNLKWQKAPSVTINQNDTYIYNSAIQPGIPSLNAFIYTFLGNNRYNYLPLKFLVFYYYVLLLNIFLYVIKKLSNKYHVDNLYSLSYGLLFFVFFWNLSRSIIFNGKEIIIYYMATLSIYMTSLLLGLKTNWRMRLALSILLGINVFINLHGVIIESVILLILIVFSKQKLWSRLYFTALIFMLSIIFGAGELVKHFVPVFVTSLGFSKPHVLNTAILNKELSTVTQHIYQTVDIASVYLKGKLQIITNVGVFGFNFWLFLLIIVKYFKQLMKVGFSRTTLFFIAVYYLVVIDPLYFNKNPVSVVLWGSPKYAGYLVFLGIIITSVFINSLISWVVKKLKKNSKLFLAGLMLCTFLLMVLFHTEIINFGTRMLSLTIPMYKGLSYYRIAVEKFFYLSLLTTLIFVISLTLSVYKMKNIYLYYFANLLIIFIVAGPFFSTIVGKVPFSDSLSFIKKDQRDVLENILYKEDIFKTFFKAKEILPSGSVVSTDYSELTLYNSGKFSMQFTDIKNNYLYKISKGCTDKQIEMFNSNDIYLCKNINND